MLLVCTYLVTTCTAICLTHGDAYAYFIFMGLLAPRLLSDDISLLDGITDGVASPSRSVNRSPYDRTVGLQRMQQVGAFLTTAEQVTFQLARTADHPRRVVGVGFVSLSTLLSSHAVALAVCRRFSPYDVFSPAFCLKAKMIRA